eukprot:12482-Heterococcus_DN1.PRE.2
MCTYYTLHCIRHEEQRRASEAWHTVQSLRTELAAAVHERDQSAASLSKLIDKKKRDLGELRRFNERIQSLQQQQRESEAALEQAHAEIARLQDDNEALVAAAAEQQQQQPQSSNIISNSNSNGNVAQQVSPKQQRNSVLEAATAADKQALAALRSEVDSLREQCETLQQQLQTVTSDNGQLEVELTAAQSEVAEAQQQAAAAVAAAEAAQASSSAAAQANTAASDATNWNNGATSPIAQLLAQSEAQVEELQTELRAEQSRRASAEAELSSALEASRTAAAREHRLQVTIDTLRADLSTATAARDTLASRLQQATQRATAAVAAPPAAVALPLPAHLTATALNNSSTIGSSSATMNESSASDTLLAHTSALSQRRHQQQPVLHSAGAATGNTVYDVESGGIASDDGGSDKGDNYVMHNPVVHALAARIPAAAAAVRRQPRAAWGAVMAEIGLVHMIAFYSVFLSSCATQ